MSNASARAMLRLTGEQLAQVSKVAVAAIVDFEVARRVPHNRPLGAIRTTLEAAGVVFADQTGGGPGVLLQKEAA